MNKQELVKRISELEAAIPDFEEKRRDMKATEKSANTQYTLGLLGVLIGIALLAAVWPLGILLIVAGALAGISNYIKRDKTRKMIEGLDKKIRTMRTDLAQARSELAVL